MSLIVNDGRYVKRQDSPRVGDISNIDVQNHTMVLAYTCRQLVRCAFRVQRKKDVHAMVVVDTTWLFRNFIKLRMETSTVKSCSGSGGGSSELSCDDGSLAGEGSYINVIHGI